MLNFPWVNGYLKLFSEAFSCVVGVFVAAASVTGSSAAACCSSIYEYTRYIYICRVLEERARGGRLLGC